MGLDKRAALLAAARIALMAAAASEERRRREVARRIAADGEAAPAEFVNGWPALAPAEEEAILTGRNLPPQLPRERAVYFRLRRGAGETVPCADPAAARRAIRHALQRAAGGT